MYTKFKETLRISLGLAMFAVLVYFILFVLEYGGIHLVDFDFNLTILQMKIIGGAIATLWILTVILPKDEIEKIELIMLPNINKNHAMLGHVAGDGRSYGSAKFAMQRKAYRLGANAVLGVMHNVDNKIENVSKSGTVRTKTTHYLQGTAIKYN